MYVGKEGAFMKSVCDKIEEFLQINEFNYEFDLNNPNYQFRFEAEIETFSPLDIFLYLNEDEFLFAMVADEVSSGEGLYEVLNKWNEESLLFKLYVDVNSHLVIESYHCYINKEDILTLLKFCMESFTDELTFFPTLKDYFIKME